MGSQSALEVKSEEQAEENLLLLIPKHILSMS